MTTQISERTFQPAGLDLHPNYLTLQYLSTEEQKQNFNVPILQSFTEL